MKSELIGMTRLGALMGSIPIADSDDFLCFHARLMWINAFFTYLQLHCLGIFMSGDTSVLMYCYYRGKS